MMACWCCHGPPIAWTRCCSTCWNVRTRAWCDAGMRVNPPVYPFSSFFQDKINLVLDFHEPYVAYLQPYVAYLYLERSYLLIYCVGLPTVDFQKWWVLKTKNFHIISRRFGANNQEVMLQTANLCKSGIQSYLYYVIPSTNVYCI